MTLPHTTSSKTKHKQKQQHKIEQKQQNEFIDLIRKHSIGDSADPHLFRISRYALWTTENSKCSK